MSLWHEDALNEHVETLLMNNHQWVQVLTQTKRRMRRRSFTEIDDVVQYHPSSPHAYSDVDAYVMANLHAALAEHKIAQFTIEMLFSAPADKHLQAISNIFEGHMAPFELSMWGKYDDQDGILSWARPIRAYFPGYEPTEATGEHQQHQGAQNILLSPTQVPVEVGVTKASRTWMHLLQDGGLARWPYGSTAIHVYVVTQALNDNEMFQGRSYPGVQLLATGDAGDRDTYGDVTDEMRWVP